MAFTTRLTMWPKQRSRDSFEFVLGILAARALRAASLFVALSIWKAPSLRSMSKELIYIESIDYLVEAL
jgi:hypothetical protein